MTTSSEDPNPRPPSAFMRATGLVVDEVGPELVVGHLDLGRDQHTPWEIVHGGVYAAAIETAVSTGASLAVRDRQMFAVGLTNTTQFLRATSGGRAELVAVALHQGRTQQLWSADVRDEVGRLLARGEVRLQNVPNTGA